MSAITKSVGADPNVYSLNKIFKLPNKPNHHVSRKQTILPGDLKEKKITECFDAEATEMILEHTPSAPGAARRKNIKVALDKAFLAPLSDQEAPIPDV